MRGGEVGGIFATRVGLVIFAQVAKEWAIYCHPADSQNIFTGNQGIYDMFFNYCSFALFILG